MPDYESQDLSFKPILISKYMGYLGLITKSHFLQIQTNKLPIKKVPANYEREHLGKANEILTMKILSLNHYTNERHCIYYLESIGKNVKCWVKERKRFGMKIMVFIIILFRKKKVMGINYSWWRIYKYIYIHKYLYCEYHHI